MGWSSLKLGFAESAANAAEKALALRTTEPKTRLNLAVILSLSGSKTLGDNTVSESDKLVRVGAYLDRAMSVLNGLKNDPVLSRPDGVKMLQTDPVFNPLRNRADFQALVDELSKSASPKP